METTYNSNNNNAMLLETSLKKAITTCKLSKLQKDEVAQFKAWWSTVQHLQNSFLPKNCCKVLAKEVEALTKWPQVTLNQVGVAYDNESLPNYFVRLLLSTIYIQVNNGKVLNQSVLDMEAGIFLAKYGNTCTMFDLMLYMATYRNTYRPDYVGGGDVSDVTKRFPDYLRHKAQVQDANKPKQDETRTEKSEPRGREALELYLREAAERGDDLLQGGLVRFGVVSVAHAKEMMAKYGPKAY